MVICLSLVDYYNIYFYSLRPPDSWSPPISVIDSQQITIWSTEFPRASIFSFSTCTFSNAQRACLFTNAKREFSSPALPPDLTFQRNLDKTENTNRGCVVNKSHFTPLSGLADNFYISTHFETSKKNNQTKSGKRQRTT